MKAIWIGNDHGGYELKLKILEYLDQHSIPYHDVGCFSTEIVRYPYYAAKVASAVSTGEADRGILVCSTGIGMSIVANKFKGVRASLCATACSGELTREHNDSNILCLGGKTIGTFEALAILEKWLSKDYIGGRHAISLRLLDLIEKVNLTGINWVNTEKEY